MDCDADKIANINLIWLRTNCRCEQCYDKVTNQTQLSDINLSAKIDKFSISEHNLEITWEDGHRSHYDLKWIQHYNRPELKPEIILWSGNKHENELPFVTTCDNKLNVNETEKLIQSILQYGVAMVRNVSPTMEATETVVRQIGPIMNTFYGGMWELTEEIFDNYEDLAYKNGDLGLHTDGTYVIETPGVQIFHCLEPAVEGGDTILVDGFKLAYDLEQKHKEYLDCLTQVPLEWQYISKFHRFNHLSSMITMGQKAGELQQIRYNSYHRSPRIPLTDNLNKFYASLKVFRDILCDPKHEWKFSLRPGNVIFIDNWRVLHGRTAFVGKRKLVGCYMSMNTLKNKARLLKLIV